MIVSLLFASAQAAADPGNPEPEIVITASRLPEEQDRTPASVSLIESVRIERLGEPLAPALIRLTPSAAVESGGPAGSLAQVRIRGAEANHTLLFIEGIRANDPAAGDIPRFELLNADLVSRIEVVRGPQSALWGSDAIGGVIAVNGQPDPKPGYSALGEAGAFGFRRAAAAISLPGPSTRLAGALGWQRATGIDSFPSGGNGIGDRDGYRNLSARLRGSWAVAPGLEAGAAAFALSGRNAFDGFDPLTFARADTLDSSRNRLSAGRLWISGGDAAEGLSGTVSASLLGSSNRNLLGSQEVNRTRGERRTLGGQAAYRFATGAIRNSALIAIEQEQEEFRARDTAYGGFSNQDRERSRGAITGEWRTEVAPLVIDLAVRRDLFSAFADATTVRASALAVLGGGVSLAGSYAEGISQPTFFDLYGFFPGSFVGNPKLRPERSRGVEASLRYRRGSLQAALTGYRQRLRDEIVDVFDPATFLSSTGNRDRASRRSGLEAEFGWSMGEQLHLTAHYALLDADEPGASAIRLREVRRARHSGSVALDGQVRRLAYGMSMVHVGARADTNFDVFPAARVRLAPYWLASARLGYGLGHGLELFGRASNLLAARYQDVFGYRTEGRALYGGVRLSAGPRSSR